MKDDKQFKPFIPADRILPEMTVTSVIVGILLAVLFGGANAYLGLRVGMTVSASIPAAVISMGIIRVIMRRNSILENNMVQTIGSAGESVAAGAIFTLPVLFMWADEWNVSAPSLIEIGLIALVGGVLGVLFMVPLRKALIVQEHGTLPYPEGKACAEVLLAGEEGGAKASTVFAGLGIAAGYKFIADGLKIFPSEVHYEITPYKGSGIGMDVLPALAGVGYICGPKISSYLLAGGCVAWLVLMPLIALFGGDAILYPGSTPISEMGSFDIWGSYIRYIGAGAVAAGGIMSLIKSLPMIVTTFKDAMKGYGKGKGGSDLRTEQDLPTAGVLIAALVVAVIIWLLPPIPVNLLGALIIVIFGFFFATVSSRMVGLIGSSNNPVSGMAIATLLVSAIIMRSVSGTGHSSYTAVIAIGAILYLFNAAWQYGTPELPAPQAMLMKMVVEGVMNANLPWVLVFAGVFIAIVVEILGIPVLPFAVGLYLPIHLSTPMMVGGLVRLFLEKRKKTDPEKKKNMVNNGVLYSSGLIAGEGLIGILLAVFAVIKINGKSIGDIINLSGKLNLGNIGGLVFFALIIVSIFAFTLWKKEKAGKN